MTSLFKAARTLTPALLAAAFMVTPLADAQNYVRIVNLKSSACGVDSEGKPYSASAAAGLRVADVNREGAALNVEKGSLAVTGFAPGWLSAQWLMQPVAGAADQYEFINRWTNKRLAAWPTAGDGKVVGVVGDEDKIPETLSQGGRAGATRSASGQEVVWKLIKTGPVKDNFGNPVDQWALTQPNVRADRKDPWRLSTETISCNAGINGGLNDWVIQIAGQLETPPPANGYVWLRRSGTQTALNIETMPPKASTVDAGWHSAQWEEKELGSAARNMPDLKGPPAIYISRWSGKALGISADGASLEMVDPPTVNAQGELLSARAVWQRVPWAPTATNASRRGVALCIGTGSAMKCIGSNKEGVLSLSPMPTQSADFFIWEASAHEPGYVPPKPVEAYVRLELTDGRAINIETGVPTVDVGEPGWWSAQWVEQRMSNAGGEQIVAYRNRFTDKFLALVNGQLAMVDAPAGSGDPAQSDIAFRLETNGAGALAIQHYKSKVYLEQSKGKLQTTSAKTFPWRSKPVQ